MFIIRLKKRFNDYMKQLKLMTRILLTTLVILFSLSFLAMIIVCISMMAPYWGETMGNEASGFFNAVLLLTFFLGIITFILWAIFLRQRNQKNETK
ncbi:hypothetical protein EGI15_23015 [Chryseobacterium cucumeris]|uniref:Uncharacterized protein n=1 Tax=Chryseobacterium cucumeris TaxID=1813611 RepID=A0ABX9X227_9FLAO|nr:hypothetical protein A1704_23155 [Chryseobacterium cucumeris]ROH86086.1 hypothetical protein EGI15_23015 [Chryseobacterium cucumeris]